MNTWLKVTAICTYEGEEYQKHGCIRISEIASFNAMPSGGTEIILKGSMAYCLKIAESYETILAAVTG